MFAAALVSNCPLILKTKRRFAIRAAEFGPETNAIFVLRGKEEFHGSDEMRGSFEGAIRISLRALSFLFNDLAFLCIPRKSLKFLTSLFSIPTAPTNACCFQRVSSLQSRQLEHRC